MSQFSKELIGNIKNFVSALKVNPDILHAQELSFLKEYLESLGAKIPPPKTSSKSASGSGDIPASASTESASTPSKEEESMEVSDDEPDEPYPEIDNEGVLEADVLDPNQEMGSDDRTASEEDMDKSSECKREAVGLFAEGKYEECVQKYTEAIQLNSGSALLFAKRGQAFLKLGKPNACIKDCNRALQINPDSAVAFKFRGRAHRLLGHWHEAAADLRQACKIDFDEQADEWLKEVTPNARKIEEWQVRKTRHDEEKEIKRRKRLAEERRRAHAEAKAHPHPTFGEDEDEASPGGFPGGMPGGMGGIPGLGNLLNDPEILALFSDPEVSEAFADITKNPMNIMKHQSNPKVAKLMKLMQQKMGGGMPGFGGMPGGFGGAEANSGGGEAPPKEEPPKKASSFADDLD